MDALFGVLGLIGMVVGIVMMLIYLITKKPKKPALIVLIVSFIMLVSGFLLSSTQSSKTAEQAQHNKSEKQNFEIILELSQKNFIEGMKYFDNKEYEKAISLFEKVSKEDIQSYQIAKEYIKQAKLLLSQELIKTAKNYLSNKNYKNAIKAAEKAVSFNPNIKNDANTLIQEATQKYKIALAEEKKKAIIEKMKQWEGDGSARVAVSNVIAMSSFNDGFTTWRPKDPRNTWYLLIGIGVVNASNSTLHVNPTYVTLICNNQVFNPDTNTFAINNYLDATNLQPGTYTTGWLLFLVPKAETYTLVYEGMFDKTVKKEIVVTETKK